MLPEIEREREHRKQWSEKYFRFNFFVVVVDIFVLSALPSSSLRYFPHKDLYLRIGERWPLTAYATWLPELDVSCCGITKLPSGRYSSSSSSSSSFVVLLEIPFCEFWYIFVDLQGTESRDLIGG